MSSSLLVLRSALAAALLGFMTPTSGSATQVQGTVVSAAEEIRSRIEQVHTTGSIVIAGRTLTVGPVAAMYEMRGFRPVWSGSKAGDLPGLIRSVADDGLDPGLYQPGAVDSIRRNRPASPADTAAADLLQSMLFAELAADLRNGRVDPGSLDASWYVSAQNRVFDGAALSGLVDASDLVAAVDSLRPSHPIYTGLRDALRRYRDLRQQGGWPTVPAGATLRSNSSDGRVVLLRRRLAVEGYLTADSMSASPIYDATVEAAVRQFQHQHGLNEDGIVGPASLAQLNVTVDERIDQIRVNLERARWILHGLAHEFVAANIAGQKVFFVRDDEVVMESRAVVGDLFRRTPVFASTMMYIVLNPTWTVPTSINREILASIRADPLYMERNGFSVVDRAGGSVDPASIDFAAYRGADFPWVFRQMPGPTNALGRIKFMFPNSFGVYLHDTPQRDAFEREQRTFSHGCIRLQDPMRLAELVLSGTSWDQAGIQAALADRVTETIALERPVPVLVLYWTAATDLHHEMHFYDDVYGRDPALLRALDSMQRFTGPAARPGGT